jgi:hypothetical protein
MTCSMSKIGFLVRRVAQRDSKGGVSPLPYAWQIGKIRFALYRTSDATTPERRSSSPNTDVSVFGTIEGQIGKIRFGEAGSP